MKWIYIIKNTINSKAYVGQTNNVQQRWAQHISAARCKTGKALIDIEMGNLGYENFHYEILEEIDETKINVDERERYWISYYNTLDPNGYNILIGGKENYGGITHPKSKIKTEERLQNITDDILNSKLSFNDIGKKYGVSAATVLTVNNGETTRLEGYTYPLRTKVYTEDLFKRLVYSLKYEKDKTLKQIAKEYKIDCSELSEINQGRVHRVDWLKYPIRKGKVAFRIEPYVDEVIHMLKDKTIPQKDIAEKYNVSKSIISQINLGRSYRRDNETYPIRENYEGKKMKLELSPDMVDLLESYLVNTSRSMRDIANEFEVDVATIMSFNIGAIKKYRKENIKYPLRIKQPVSTSCA